MSPAPHIHEPILLDGRGLKTAETQGPATSSPAFYHLGQPLAPPSSLIEHSSSNLRETPGVHSGRDRHHRCLWHQCSWKGWFISLAIFHSAAAAIKCSHKPSLREEQLERVSRAQSGAKFPHPLLFLSSQRNPEIKPPEKEANPCSMAPKAHPFSRAEEQGLPGSQLGLMWPNRLERTGAGGDSAAESTDGFLFCFSFVLVWFGLIF